MGDTFTAGSSEVPEVLKTLAGVLPQFRGADLEAQLQTYDTFIDMGVDRFKIAELLEEAAKKTTDAKARARIEWAVENVRTGGRAAAPYDHAEAMAEYTKKFAESYATPVAPPAPAAPGDANAEVFGTPEPKRAHPKLLKKLDEIEAEMKKLGYWVDEPDVLFEAKIAKGEASIVNAPTFELWLQRVFIPRARAAATDDMLPKRSQVGQIAFKQYDYMNSVPEAADLTRMLGDFDELIGLASVGGA